MIPSALFSALSDIGTPFSLDVQQIADQRRAIGAFGADFACACVRSIPPGFRLSSIPIGAIVETGTAWGVPAAVEPPVYFCRLMARVILLVFLLVSAAIDDENYFKFKWLWN
jgi:hypothetical protein